MEARARRATLDAALEIFRAVGGRRLRGADRRLHQGDRREGRHLPRVLRGRAAQGLGRRQYRRRPGPVLGALFAAAPVPAEMPRRHRRRRLPRQEIRRLGRERADLRQERQQMDRHPDLLQRQHDELSHLVAEEGRLLQIPRDHRRLPRICQGDQAQQHARRHRARPRLGRRQRLGALVPVGVWRQPRRQERQGHPQLAGDRQGAGIRQAALREHDPGHRLVERRLQQQGLPRRRDPLDRQRHLDLRRGQPRRHQEGHRRGHEPRGVADRAGRQADRVPPDVSAAWA